MVLLFLRHGDAEDFGPDGSDSSRRLTPEAEVDNRAVIEAVLRAGARPDRIVHSPLFRAEQTARAAAEVLAPPGGVHADERLKGGATVADVSGIVEDHPAGTLMLVGHNPDFSMIVGALVGGGSIAMKTSSVACIDLAAVAPGAGRLEWLVRPALVAGA